MAMKKRSKARSTATARERTGAGGDTAFKRAMKALGIAVPSAQWDLPAGFGTDGTIASLKQVVDPKTPTLTLAELSDQQRADLTIKRIEAQPDFKLEMLGAGTIDKDRAVAEIDARSKIGVALMEIEQRVINNLLERASAGVSTKGG
jgi:hypothetical protein